MDCNLIILMDEGNVEQVVSFSTIYYLHVCIYYLHTIYVYSTYSAVTSFCTRQSLLVE
jgi:hypothetical protein